MVDILESIYQVKKKNDIFVLSNGHAAIAYYAVLEEHGLLDKGRIDSLMVHPDASLETGVSVSSGSLGQGLPIALGWALADRKSVVYCSISDGECMEGSIWESLRIVVEQKVSNLCIVVNANGWGAYRSIDLKVLKRQLKGFGFKVNEVDGHNLRELVAVFEERPRLSSESQPEIIFARTTVEQYPFLVGQTAHYHVMTQENYDSTH